MSEEDFAIVVGIARYPELGEGRTPLDLQGPHNDVDLIVEWLKGPGRVPDKNITCLKSSLLPAATAANAFPTFKELHAIVEDLDQRAQKNKDAGKGLQIGRRLYIYMSGHGFSPARQRGCLFTADAKERAFHNVHASGWLNWFQDAAYFREFVLLMDCCMNRVALLQPGDLTIPAINAATPPGPTFVAFAAQRPLKAVEAPILEDDGKIHGLFTWMLVEGLKGAAADANGRVTGRSLADWIRNAQSARMSQEDLTDPEVANEPEIIKEDAGLILARGVLPPKFLVSLSFPAVAVAKVTWLWAGAPPKRQPEFTVDASGEHNIELTPGLYLVEVPSAGLRHGFEVLGPTNVSVRDRGDPVTPPAGDRLFTLTVQPQDPTAEIYVIDSRFALVDGNPGSLITPLPFGLFKVKTRLGRGIKEKVVLVDRDALPLDEKEIVEPPATVAAIEGTAVTHEYQVAAATQAITTINQLGAAGHRCALTLMARVWTRPDRPAGDALPWEGLSVVDRKGNTVIDLAHDGLRHENGDQFAVHTVPLEPGTYFLRRNLADGGIVEQSLVLVENWGLEAHVLRRGGRSKADSRPRVSIFMRDLRAARDPREVQAEDRIIEAARVALADERRILNERLSELLMLKYNDPIAGIIGAHLLLSAYERNEVRDLEMLNTVIRNLRRNLGSDHPDVEALSLRCPDEDLRRKRAINSPPLFQRSWKLLVEESYQNTAILPRAVWRRAQAQMSLSPYLVWSADEESKAAVRRELARAAWRPPTRSAASRSPEPAATFDMALPVGGPARPAAREEPRGRRRDDWKRARERALQLQVPRAALDLLAEEYAANPED
jgi:hypothetical protein